MNIEKDVFKKGKMNFSKLVSYGFLKKDSIYYYSKIFMKNFKVCVIVDLNGNVFGKIYDLKTSEEYTNFRIEDLMGFAHQVREEYISILEDIAQNVLDTRDFLFFQSNRVAQLIKDKYEVVPEFLWDKNPNFGVFRNNKSKKWFGIIMNVDKSKVMHNLSGEIEILNVKLDDQLVEYIKKKGIYPAYHMNKKSWVSVILDDTLSDEEIMKLVNISYHYADITNSWVIPANLKYYDIIKEFEHTDTIVWHQDMKVSVGDLVYIYLTIPYQAIMYKCEVVEVDIPFKGLKNMKLKLVKTYDQKEFTLEKLKLFGLTNIRGARRVPAKLSKVL